MGELIEPGDDERRLFVSRYIDRGGRVASSKIEVTDDIITYRHDSEHLPPAEFDPLEFLAALSVHIPNIRLRLSASARQEWEQLSRHYGYYSGLSKKFLVPVECMVQAK